VVAEGFIETLFRRLLRRRKSILPASATRNVHGQNTCSAFLADPNAGREWTKPIHRDMIAAARWQAAYIVKSSWTKP
jgi:hypothetical protein